MGVGYNLLFYDFIKVEKVWGLEFDLGICKYVMLKVDVVLFDVEFLDLLGEEILFEDKSVDMVLIIYMMCLILGVYEVFLGMCCVLKFGGWMIFCEYGIVLDVSVRNWQDWINFIWRGISGGCNVNWNILKLIDDVGFKV